MEAGVVKKMGNFATKTHNFFVEMGKRKYSKISNNIRSQIRSLMHRDYDRRNIAQLLAEVQSR